MSMKYRARFVNRNTLECDWVGLSDTDSGMGFGFAQMISDRRNQPSARRANARSQGAPIKSFGLYGCRCEAV